MAAQLENDVSGGGPHKQFGADLASRELPWL
jgi:hypothetical protein